jgi:dihydroorotate dehydrogenase (NAD+) catalytic subunit
MAIDVETKLPILSNKFGGLSGTPIKPIALRCVYEISSKYDIPIIGCGGISTWEDAVEFFLAGASAIQIGSAVGDDWIDVFDDINNGIISYMKRNGFSKIEDMVGIAKKS